MSQWWLERLEPEQQCVLYVLFESGQEVARIYIYGSFQDVTVFVKRNETSPGNIFRALREPSMPLKVAVALRVIERFIFLLRMEDENAIFILAPSAAAARRHADLLHIEEFRGTPSGDLVEDFLESLEQRRSTQTPPEYRLVAMQVILNGTVGARRKRSWLELEHDAGMATLRPAQLERYAICKAELVLRRSPNDPKWKTLAASRRSAKRDQQNAIRRLRRWQSPKRRKP